MKRKPKTTGGSNTQRPPAAIKSPKPGVEDRPRPGKTGLRDRAEARLRKAGGQLETQPMLPDLYSRAETRLRRQPKSRRPKDKMPEPAANPTRLFHELQVHHLEVEMQNTELQKARDELEMALERYTDLYDLAPVGYFTLARSGVIQQVNLTGARLAGFDRSALVGRTFDSLVSAGLRPAFLCFLERVFAAKAKQTADFDLSDKGRSGRAVNLEAQRSANGRECRIVVVDISERKRVEDRVRVSEIRYRRLFETAHDGVLLIDPDTRKITEANPFMTQLLGHQNAELVGKELHEIGVLRDGLASQEMVQKLQRNPKIRYEDLTLESQKGRHQEVEVVASLYQENGHAVIQCHIRDITERKRAEEAQRRIAVLDASNRKLEKEIVRRRAVETSLQQSERHQRRLLGESRRMQEQLRHLSHQLLLAQEEERKRISRDLHDVIAQTLTSINVRLAELKSAAVASPRVLERSITRTQKLVEQSVNIVHRFALDLRPRVLDDLGLIPALHALMKGFKRDTGIHVSLSAFAEVEQVKGDKRTVLYRVAQEALTNVARHAQATRAEVEIQKRDDALCMNIKDNGKGFPAERVLHAKKTKRLGLHGMRERLDMVGGNLSITSAPGKGTTVAVQVPLMDGLRRGGGGRCAHRARPRPSSD